MSAELDALTQRVHQNTTVIQGAIELINGIADRIRAAGTDPAALQALTDELEQQDNALASAVAANTPAEGSGGDTTTGGTGGDTTGGASSGGTDTTGGAASGTDTTTGATGSDTVSGGAGASA